MQAVVLSLGLDLSKAQCVSEWQFKASQVVLVCSHLAAYRAGLRMSALHILFLSVQGRHCACFLAQIRLQLVR